MKTRKMSNGDRPYFSTEICELDGELDTQKHPNRLMANNHIQNVSSDGWLIWQVEQSGDDDLIFEFRSERNHLAVVVLSPDEARGEALALATFNELN